MPNPAEAVQPPDDIATLGARAATQLVIRTILMRVVTLIGTIALARLLTPEEFGAFAVITLIVTLASIAGDLGVTASLIQQDHEPTDIELSTANAGQIGAGVAVVALVWLVAGLIPIVRPDLPSDSVALARLLALGVLIYSFRAVPTMMLSRVLRFGPLAIVEVGQQVVYFGVAVALAVAGWGIWSFAVAGIAQAVFGVVVVNAVWRRWVGVRFDLSVARRLWGFGVRFQAAHVLAWARDAVVPLFGGIAGGLTAVGYLNFAWRNGQLVSAVEQIIHRVGFPAYSRLQRDPGRQAALAESTVTFAIVPVAVVQAWIIATAPQLVPTVFSARWSPAISVLQLVCLASLAGAPTFVLRALLQARGQAREAMVLVTLSVAVLLVTFPWLASVAGLDGAGWSIVLSGYTGLALHILVTRAFVRFPWTAVARILLEVGLAGALAMLVASRLDGLLGLVASGVVYLTLLGAIGATIERPLLRRLVRVARA
jgi:PST family polysaccharide transporter